MLTAASEVVRRLRDVAEVEAHAGVAQARGERLPSLREDTAMRPDRNPPRPVDPQVPPS